MVRGVKQRKIDCFGALVEGTVSDSILPDPEVRRKCMKKPSKMLGLSGCEEDDGLVPSPH